MRNAAGCREIQTALAYRCQTRIFSVLFQKGFQRCQIFFPGVSDVKRMNAAGVGLIMFIGTAPSLFQITDTASTHQRRDDADFAGLRNFFFLLFFGKNK